MVVTAPLDYPMAHVIPLSEGGRRRVRLEVLRFAGFEDGGRDLSQEMRVASGKGTGKGSEPWIAPFQPRETHFTLGSLEL